MHEIAKPLNRIKQNPNNIMVELERLNEIYLIADSIRNKENQKYIIETVNMDKTLETILNKYKSYIDLYKITIKLENNKHHLQSSAKLIEFALDNIVRNAIEASIEFSGEKNIYIIIDKNIITVKNAFNGFNFNKTNLFKPMTSSKIGHMGVGLYITKMILENLKHKINVLVVDDTFEVQIVL
jgi:signal transduction histidine kinase